MSTTSENPLISVILPVYNAGANLVACLDSLVSQSYINLEIIAIDDFSKDDSWKVLKIYKKFDKRIKIYKNVKQYGKAITLNRALRKAKGVYVAFMNAEDSWYKDKLKKQISFLQENSKVAAVGTQCTFINDDGKRIGISTYPHENDAIYHKPHHGISMHFETLLVNRLILPKDLLKFSTKASKFLYSDILIKLLQYGQLINLPHRLHYHRKHTIYRKHSITNKVLQLPSFMKLWIKSVDAYDYRPSLTSFLFSVFNPNISQ